MCPLLQVRGCTQHPTKLVAEHSPDSHPPPPEAGHGVAKSSFITPCSLRADLQRGVEGGHGHLCHVHYPEQPLPRGREEQVLLSDKLQEKCGFSSALRTGRGGGGGHNCNALQCWKLDPQLQGCSTVTHPLRCLMHNIRDRDLSKQSASLQACRCCTPRCKAQHLLLPPPGTNDAI